MAGYKDFNHTKNQKEKEFHDKFIELFGDYNKIAEIISNGVYPYYINGNESNNYIGRMANLMKDEICSLDDLIQFSQKTHTSGESPFLPNCGFGIIRKKKNYPIPSAL